MLGLVKRAFTVESPGRDWSAECSKMANSVGSLRVIPYLRWDDCESVLASGAVILASIVWSIMRASVGDSLDPPLDVGARPRTPSFGARPHHHGRRARLAGERRAGLVRGCVRARGLRRAGAAARSFGVGRPTNLGLQWYPPSSRASSWLPSAMVRPKFGFEWNLATFI